MAQKFKQVRFYNLAAANNEPHYDLEADMIKGWGEGKLFEKYVPIIRLGISAPPGTRFTINESDTEVVINYTGLFEVDFSDSTGIVALKFNEASLNHIRQNPAAWVIVDMIYEGEGD